LSRLRQTVLFLALLTETACTVGSIKNHYLLAESLWMKGKFEAAVVEFEKAAQKGPQSKVGLQALLRAATTQMFYLSQYREALKNLKLFIERSEDASEVWKAKKQIGELLFSKLEHYGAAIEHYRFLLTQKPTEAEAAGFLYRIGRAQFFLWKFEQAIQTFEQVVLLYPGSSWAEKAQFDRAETLFTQAGQTTKEGVVIKKGEPYAEAMRAYEAFLKSKPKSALVPQAEFGVASCLEEMDQVEAAYQKYLLLLKNYPSPRVIQIKLGRIAERKRQQNH
jgi:TolA-binding protein